MSAAQAVTIIEVSPRDGLQNEAVVLDPSTRIELIRRLVDDGARRIEAVSFVHPRLVPAMAGAEEVMAGVPRDGRATYIGLALNERGTVRALDAAVDEINFVLPVTESFAHANQRSSVEGVFAAMVASSELARNAGVPFTVTLAVAFGCPFEGDVPRERTVELSRRVLGEAAVAELALADTIGCAVPAQVFETFAAVASLGAGGLRAHFHETRHTGLANAYAALEAGVTRLDSSVGGLGGCPFAPGAKGNLATEDLLWMLDRSPDRYRLADRLDGEALAATGAWIAARVDSAPRSSVADVGYFPRTALGPRT